MNLILIVVDTLRADHLSCYGYGKKTSPNIDRIAKRGTKFSNCFAQNTSTHPGFTTILTGLYPISHRIVSHRGKEDLSDNILTLPEILKKNDYTTVAIDNLYDRSAREIRLYPWFRKGYDYYLYPRDSEEPNQAKKYGDAKETTDLAIDWIRKSHRRKFFMLVHYFNTHARHNPNPEYISPDKYHKFPVIDRAEFYRNLYLDPRLIDRLVSLYDAAINYVDDEIGRLLDLLDQLKIAQNTFIILTSDHGEILGENRIYLGKPCNFCHLGLHDEVIHIPLLFKAIAKIPCNRGLDNLVQQVDIAPTILDIFGIKNTYEMDGMSLISLIRGGESNSTHGTVHFSENTLSCKRGIRKKQWKFMKLMDDELYGVAPKELYNLREDPYELFNLVDRERNVANKLEEGMEEWVRFMLGKRNNRDPLIDQDITAEGRRIRDLFNIKKVT